MRGGLPGPKITAFQTIILSAQGAPDMPPGGSDCNLLKSLTIDPLNSRQSWNETMSNDVD